MSKYWMMILVILAGACMTGVAPDSEGVALAGASAGLGSMSWSTVNDTVMGGRSSASLTLGQQGELLWSGNLSLENNGGFVSIRTQGAWFDWSGFDGLEVVVEGAGRTIQVTAQRRDNIVRAGGYRAAVPTKATGETKVFIPFSAFELKRFGRAIRGPSLTDGLQNAGQLGLLMADKKEGPFRVTLKSIKPVRHREQTQVKSEVLAELSGAIERGVPVFNRGDAQGCADIYAEVLTGLLSKKMLGVDTWAERLVLSAQARALKENPVEAAWTLRRAMDGVLWSLRPLQS